MAIQKDAGEILIFLYQEYTNNNQWIDSDKIIKLTNWESGRINRTIDYLKDLNLIKINLFLGNINGVYNFGINGLTPAGINIIENTKEFEKNFGFELNLGLIKFSWGTTKK
ncbi:MAG: hypothetical protein PHF86_08230 [Candidatus Nanoarchaeia archaeon]|nr:hypothetical protein [Candidatus Nanoarchaeia archaeon]